MSTEADEILSKVRRVKNVGVEGEIKEKAVRFMTPQEKETKKADMEWVDGILSPANQLPGHIILEQAARKQLVGYQRFLKKDLAENCAPELSGEAKDALAKRRDFLIEKIREGMPPQEVMRRAPTGALGQHQKWMATTKEYQLEYKNIQRALEPDDQAEEAANIEMLRPSMAGAPGSASTFMADSWTPGFFAQSAQAKENWPLGDPKVDTPLAQAERRELEELRKFKAKKDVEKKEHSEKIKAGWQKAREKHIKKAEREYAKLQKQKEAAAVSEIEQQVEDLG